MNINLNWQEKDTPTELHDMLTTLGSSYPIAKNGRKGIKLSFEKSSEKGQCSIKLKDDNATITYSTSAQAGRGVGALLSGLVSKTAGYSESTPFEMLGIMLDCSRNAVMLPERIKLWLRRLSLLGYNMVMLYTEDTCQLEEGPWF